MAPFRKVFIRSEPPKPINIDDELNLFKFDVLDVLISRTYVSFSKTLDTEDYVSEKVNNKIRKLIFKNFKKSFKKLGKTCKKAKKYGVEPLNI